MNTRPRVRAVSAARYCARVGTLVVGIGALAAALTGCTSARAARTSTPAAPPPPAVVVTAAIQHAVPIYDEIVAQTVALQTIQLRPQIAGTIEEIRFKQGSEVRRGQTLFVIDQRPYKAALDGAQAQLATAQASLTQALKQTQVAQAKAQLLALQAPLLNARDNVKRDRYLFSQGAIAAQQVESDEQTAAAAEASVAAQEEVVKNTALAQQISIAQARAGVQQAQAGLEQAQLNLRYTVITAPMDGVVGFLEVDLGNLVAVNQVLATMSTVDPIVVQFNASEITYLSLLKPTGGRPGPGRSAVGIPTFRLLLADGSLYPQPGTFRDIDRSVNAASGTIAIQALFPNPSGYLRPGMYGRVRASTGQRPDAVLIPQVAVQQTQNFKTVLVVGSDNLVAVRTIEDGGTFGPFEIVLNGVQEGDRVIVEGLQRAQPGARVSVTVRPAPPVPSEGSTP